MTGSELPPEYEFETIILRLLRASAHPLKASEVYDPLADALGLTAQQRLIPRNTRTEPKFRQIAQRVRARLVETGRMNKAPPEDSWSLTEDGKRYADLRGRDPLADFDV